MADSEALRARRRRRHKAGDHSLCKRCAAVRGDSGMPESITAIPPAAAIDPLAELRQLAARLAEAYRAEPGNAMLARELRLTLTALMPQGGNSDSDLDDLFAELRA